MDAFAEIARPDMARAAARTGPVSQCGERRCATNPKRCQRLICQSTCAKRMLYEQAVLYAHYLAFRLQSRISPSRLI